MVTVGYALGKNTKHLKRSAMYKKNTCTGEFQYIRLTWLHFFMPTENSQTEEEHANSTDKSKVLPQQSDGINVRTLTWPFPKLNICYSNHWVVEQLVSLSCCKTNIYLETGFMDRYPDIFRYCLIQFRIHCSFSHGKTSRPRCSKTDANHNATTTMFNRCKKVLINECSVFLSPNNTFQLNQKVIFWYHMAY